MISRVQNSSGMVHDSKNTALFIAVFLTFLFVAVAAYSSILNNTLIGDDYFYSVKAGELSFTGLWHLFDNHPSFIRPVPSFFFWLQFKAFGVEATPYHLFNIFVHAGNAFLLFWLLLRLGMSRLTGIMSGLLFTVAPVAAEPVTWASGRYDLLSTFFILLATGLYLTSVKKNSYPFYAGALAAAFTAMFCKESAMILVIIFPVIELLYGFPGEGSNQNLDSWQARLRASSPRLVIFYSLFAGYVALRLAILGRLGGYRDVPLLSAPDPLTATKTIWTFLSPLNSQVVSRTVIAIIGGLFLALLIVSLALVLSRWKRATRETHRAWILLLVLLIATMVPVNTQLFRFGIGHNLKDSRELYIITLLAISLMMISLFEFGWEKISWRIAAAAAIVLLLIPWTWGLRENNTLWERASVISLEILEDTRGLLPDPPPDAKLYFIGVPEWDGAYVYVTSLKHALADYYGRKDLQVMTVKQTDEDYDVNETSDGYLFVYDREIEEIVLIHGPGE